MLAVKTLKINGQKLINFYSISFINNGRTRRPLTPIKYMEKKTVSTIDSDNTKKNRPI